MRKFIYVIGCNHQFDSLDELMACYEQEQGAPRDAQSGWKAYPVELREDTQVVGYKTLEEIATIIALGEAMCDGWVLDDTEGTLIEV